MTPQSAHPSPSLPRRVLRVGVLGLLVIATLAAWFDREAIRHFILAKAVLLADVPNEEAIQEVVDQAKDPPMAARALWRSRKLVQREAALRQLSRLIPDGEPIPARLESWVLAAALDPDMNVRETAFGILSEHKDPALAAMCLAQLHDQDPETRLLGLNNFKQISAAVGVPSVIPLLNDADPRIVTLSLNLLEHWTGQSFGVKLFDAVPTENKVTGLMEFSQEGAAKAQAGAERAKLWWAAHQAQFAPVHLEVPAPALANMEAIPAPDFSLSSLDGRQVKLSDLRGKVVLINFWTTWCTACVGELPELIELQKHHHEQVVILGISLDGLTDDDDPHAADRPTSAQIREKVARTVKTRGINYTVLLDEKSNAGGRYNGGELPTTVIVDAEGNVRRRFIGARSLAVFEAMIAEATQPPHALAKLSR